MRRMKGRGGGGEGKENGAGARGRGLMLFLKGQCVCVCVWRTLPRVKPPRDPTVISVIDTNMFIVLLCPTGEKDPVLII